MTSPSTLDARHETGQPALFICPYCGGATPDQPRCGNCRGFLDPLSRQASQNAMGPWFIRDETGAVSGRGGPFRPGCSYETLAELASRKKVAVDTIIRGPSTNQFWMPARRVPGLAHLLGVCHACKAQVDGVEHECPDCHASFEHPADRQSLGLLPVMLLPGQGSAEMVASSTMGGQTTSGNAAPGVMSPYPGGTLSDKPSQAILRHVGLIESQLRWAWILFITVLVLFAVAIAVASAAIFSGLIVVTMPQDSQASASPSVSAAPIENPSLRGAHPPRAPAATPDTPAEPAPAIPDAAKPDPASPAVVPGPAAVPQSIESQARVLLTQDTTDSLSRAETMLQEAINAGDKNPSLAQLLTVVRERKTHHALKGVR